MPVTDPLSAPQPLPSPAHSLALDVLPLLPPCDMVWSIRLSSKCSDADAGPRGVIPAVHGKLCAFMNLLRSLICRIRVLLPSCPEGPIDRLPPRITAHQTSTSLEAITRPGSGSLLCRRQGHSYCRPSVTIVRRSTRPKCWITPWHAAEGPLSSRSSQPRAASCIEAKDFGAGQGGGLFRSFSPGREWSS
ncbi:hypothetical protein NDU88_008804 [Pleurodeles waltl]|uniref:Uncharacterized protein n=1 Tax=Pleurodeles waltl TaxID=8319 RepID=A0AAV7RXY6_PLEWA|nr:hypothetical protein NDU88_008804 [Pleurodeles waltl]